MVRKAIDSDGWVQQPEYDWRQTFSWHRFIISPQDLVLNHNLKPYNLQSLNPHNRHLTPKP